MNIRSMGPVSEIDMVSALPLDIIKLRFKPTLSKSIFSSLNEVTPVVKKRFMSYESYAFVRITKLDNGLMLLLLWELIEAFVVVVVVVM